MTFTTILKYLFVIFIVVQFVPLTYWGLKSAYEEYVHPKTKVGVIKITEAIADDTKIVRNLRKFFKDDTIKAIVLVVDSPGGKAGAGELIFREILELKGEHQKPIITQVKNVCASGAYWVAAATDYIIAPGTAMVGSIGAYFPYLFEVDEFLKHYNIKYHAIKAGKYKMAGDPFKPMSPQEHEMLQGALNDTYDQFTRSVAQARNVSLDDKDKWAEGRIMTGEQALAVGLIDQIGSLQTVMNVLREKIKVEEDIEWVYADAKKSMFASFFEDTSQEPLTKIVHALITMLVRTHSSDALAVA